MESFSHTNLIELFDHIRVGKSYYCDNLYIVTNEGGSDIAQIAYINNGEWRIFIDNFPGRKLTFHYNFPIKDEYQFQSDMERIGLVLKIKLKKCPFCDHWKEIRYGSCEECSKSNT